MPAFAKENGGPLTTAQIQVLVKEIKGIPYSLVEKEEAGDTPPSIPGENGRRVEVVADTGGISPRWGVPPEPPEAVPPYRKPLASSNGHRAGTMEKGALAFARACAVCHGAHGQGIEKGGEQRRAINDPVFLALMSNQALRRYVITGRPDLGMPSYADARPDDPHFVPLTDQEVTDLVALLASWRGEQ
jgi:mono/diheme cytochrome c family protein